MKVLALLFGVAQGYMYTINAYPNTNCSGMPAGTSTVNNVNGSCASVSWTNAMDNVTTAWLSFYCSLTTSMEGVSVWSSLYGANCSVGACENTNSSTAMCQYFPSVYPNVSFGFTNTGGVNQCAALVQLEADIAKILCVSGDTVIPTRSGSVLAKDLEVGTDVLTAQGDYKPVQMFWHRMPESASCLKVCSKATQDCATVSHEHYIRSSQGFETAETLSSAEFVVSPATCDGLVSFYVEGGSFVTKEGGMEISCFSKTWGLGHNALQWLTEWSGILYAPIRDWTFFAEASRCLSKGAVACALGSLAKLA